MRAESIDAILLLSFGGPEGLDDVMPFLRNVTQGRNVPEERLKQVARHYELFNGVSPINEQNRQLIKALQVELETNGINLPIFWGNRNWHPLLSEALSAIVKQGCRRVLAFATSAYSSYSSCRQYLEDIVYAQAQYGDNAPVVVKIPPFFSHPLFVECNKQRLDEALYHMKPSDLANINVAFTAHSIPLVMAKGCQYDNQLQEVASSIASAKGFSQWRVVYQSRSGSPNIPWLEPDICDYIRELAKIGANNLVIAPIGFISDHMEVIYDLDIEAQKVCEGLGITMVRAKTAGTHPLFVRMIRELIEAHLTPDTVSQGSEIKESLNLRNTAGKSSLIQTLCFPDCCPRTFATVFLLLFCFFNAWQQAHAGNCAEHLFKVNIVRGQWRSAAGISRQYALYIPAFGDKVEKEIHPLVMLIHGFLMTGHEQSYTAQFFAERGFVVITPNITKVLLGDVTRMRNIYDLIDLIVWLTSNKQSPVYHKIDSQAIGIAGNSSGGAVVLELLIQMQKLKIPVKAVCSMDGVPWDRSWAEVAMLKPVRFLSLRAESGICNEYARMSKCLQSIKFPIDDVKINGAHHCDAENPTSLGCECICGKSKEKYRLLFRQVLYTFFQDALPSICSSHSVTFAQAMENLQHNHTVMANLNCLPRIN